MILSITQRDQKSVKNKVLTPLETMAADIIEMHPEYHEVLLDPDSKQADYTVEQGQTNPFLHLSMHLAINEQVSIDHPPGIKQAFEQISKRIGEHEAVHVIMEALGEVIWEAQRLNKPLDNQRYLELILRHTTKSR